MSTGWLNKLLSALRHEPGLSRCYCSVFLITGQVIGINCSAASAYVFGRRNDWRAHYARGLLTNESVSVRNEVGTWPPLTGSFEASLFIIYPLSGNLQVIIIIIVVDIPR